MALVGHMAQVSRSSPGTLWFSLAAKWAPTALDVPFWPTLYGQVCVNSSVRVTVSYRYSEVLLLVT